MSETEFDRWCWTVDAHVEFVDGKVIESGPIRRLHNELSHFLITLLGVFLDQRPTGRLCGPRFLVRLRKGLQRVPDLSYIAAQHEDQITPTYLNGAPDIVWEIVSRDSVARDWRDKFHEYQVAGVQEYWIIDPAHQILAPYRLDGERYSEVEPQNGRYASEVIRGFWLKDEWLWQLPPPGALGCLREMGVISLTFQNGQRRIG